MIRIFLTSALMLILLFNTLLAHNCPIYDPNDSNFSRNPPIWDKFTYRLVRDSSGVDPTISFVFSGIPVWKGPNIGLFFKAGGSTGFQTDLQLQKNFNQNNGLNSIPNCVLKLSNSSTTGFSQMLECSEQKLFNNSNYIWKEDLNTCLQEVEVKTNFSLISSNPEFWKGSYVSITWFFGFFAASSMKYFSIPNEISFDNYGKEFGNLLNKKLFWKEEHSAQFTFNAQSFGKNDSDPEVLVSEIDTYSKYSQKEKNAFFMLSIQTYKGFRVSNDIDEGFNDLFFVPLSGGTQTVNPTKNSNIFSSQLNFESSLFLHDPKNALSVFIMKYLMLSPHVIGYVNFKGNYCQEQFFNSTSKCSKNNAIPFTQKFDNLEFRASIYETEMSSVVPYVLNLRFSNDINSRIVLGSEKSINYLLVVLDFDYESYYCTNIEFELIERIGGDAADVRYDLINGPYYKVAKALGDVPRDKVPDIFRNNVVILVELDNSFGFFSNVAKPAKFKINWKVQQKPSKRAQTSSDFLYLKGYSFKITETDFKLDYRAPTVLYGTTSDTKKSAKNITLFAIFPAFLLILLFL